MALSQSALTELLDHTRIPTEAPATSANASFSNRFPGKPSVLTFAEGPAPCVSTIVRPIRSASRQTACSVPRSLTSPPMTKLGRRRP